MHPDVCVGCDFGPGLFSRCGRFYEICESVDLFQHSWGEGLGGEGCVDDLFMMDSLYKFEVSFAVLSSLQCRWSSQRVSRLLSRAGVMVVVRSSL